MAVLDRNQKQKIYTSTLLASLVVALILFVVLLIATASNLSQTTGVAVGKIGLLELFELSKTAMQGGGYEGGLKFLYPGLATYFAICLIAGSITAYVRAGKEHKV